MIDLKPCPFCGADAQYDLFLGSNIVTCTECTGAAIGQGLTKDEIAEMWNARTGGDEDCS